MFLKYGHDLKLSIINAIEWFKCDVFMVNMLYPFVFYFAASRKEITPIIDIIYLDHNLCHIWFNISVSIKYVFYCQSRLTISNRVIVYVTLTKHTSRRLVSCMKNTYKQNTFCECIWISIDGVSSFAKSSTKVWYYRNCHLVDTS